MNGGHQRFRIRVRNRPSQQRSHFFLNIDHSLGLTQLLGQPLVGTLQLLVLFGEGIALGFRPALPWLESLPNAGCSFMPPLRRCDEYRPSRRKRAPMPPCFRTAASAFARICRLYSAVNLRRLALATTSGSGGQRRLLRCRLCPSAGTPFGLASLGLTTFRGGQSRRRPRWDRILHLVFPSALDTNYGGEGVSATLAQRAGNDFGDQGTTLAIRERLWRSGNDLATRIGNEVGNQGTTLAIRERLWQSGNDFGNQGTTLAIRERLWQSGNDFGNQGTTLAIRERLWQSGNDFGNQGATSAI